MTAALAKARRGVSLPLKQGTLRRVLEQWGWTDVGALGWAEMVENAVRIDVECLDDRPQAGEAQAGKGKMPA